MKLCYLLVLFVLGSWSAAARAEHATIDLRVERRDPATRAVKDEARAHADEDPPAGGVNPRPLLRVKAKEPLVLQFIYINTYPHGEVKDVTIRYFVVREEKAGQKALPDLKKGTVIQGRFNLNFKPQTRVGARLPFTLASPGIYLIRLQSENTKSDHEHFAAIDVQVE